MTENIIEYLLKLGIHSNEYSTEISDDCCLITFNKAIYDEYYSPLHYIWIEPSVYLERVAGSKESDNTITVPYSVCDQKGKLKVLPTSVETINRRSYGFISPDGIFYQCEYEQHIYLEPILFDHGQFSIMVDEYDADKHSGWLRLTGASMTKCEFIFDYYDEYKIGFGRDAKTLYFERSLTKKQLEFISNYNKQLNKTAFNFNFHDFNSMDELFVYLEFHNYAYEK